MKTAKEFEREEIIRLIKSFISTVNDITPTSSNDIILTFEGRLDSTKGDVIFNLRYDNFVEISIDNKPKILNLFIKFVNKQDIIRNIIKTIILEGLLITPVKVIFLAQLSAMRELSMIDCKLDDISFLKNFTKLDSLTLYNNQVTNISPLRELTNLTYLDLSYNTIVDLIPIEKLTKLTTLSIESNDISDILPIGNLVNLTVLVLDTNLIQDLIPIEKLTKLTTLSIENNYISDISPLAKLTNLENLFLEFNKISNLKSQYAIFNNLTKITDWHSVYSGNPIQDITFETLSQGRDAILNFFGDTNKQLLNRVKIIMLGNSGAGKSSLIEYYDTNKLTVKSSTHGFELKQVALKPLIQQGGESNIILNIFDFGGQHYYHGTYKLFLSQAIYLYLCVNQDLNIGEQPVLRASHRSNTNNSKSLHYNPDYWLNIAKEKQPDPTNILTIYNDTEDEPGFGIGSSIFKIDLECVEGNDGEMDNWKEFNNLFFEQVNKNNREVRGYIKEFLQRVIQYKTIHQLEGKVVSGKILTEIYRDEREENLEISQIKDFFEAVEFLVLIGEIDYINNENYSIKKIIKDYKSTGSEIDYYTATLSRFKNLSLNPPCHNLTIL